MRLDSIFQDVRYAVRTFSRTPIFAATVAATMGLALGLVGSAFTLLNAYLIRPVNLPNPRALHALSWDTETTFYERFGLADYEALEPEARRLAERGSHFGRLGHARRCVDARPACNRQLFRDAWRTTSRRTFAQTR